MYWWIKYDILPWARLATARLVCISPSILVVIVAFGDRDRKNKAKKYAKRWENANQSIENKYKIRRI